MTQDTDMGVEQVMEVRSRSLTENYEPHDMGQDYISGRLKGAGYEIVQHGTDDRHNDEKVFGDGPDIELRRGGETKAYVEIKTKRAEYPEWMGRLNRRHFNEYVEFAVKVDVPVYLWFALVDEDNSVIKRKGFIEVQGESQVVNEIPDVMGNDVVCLDEADFRSLEHVLYTLE